MCYSQSVSQSVSQSAQSVSRSVTLPYSRILAIGLFCRVAGWLSLVVLIPHFIVCLLFLVVPYELLPDIRYAKTVKSAASNHQ